MLKAIFERHSMYSKYESAEALAQFIASQIPLLESGNITKEGLAELWRIFAPTSEFDDYLDDVDLGNQIFEDLEKMRRPT